MDNHLPSNHTSDHIKYALPRALHLMAGLPVHVKSPIAWI
ncbi:hypothetical protein F383_07608 [Gossypium arboreum]|uniref:Uncharacterized protein n=1 Tax=Gossypium arboreum TaxID=29729 RepID=A0A0B0NVJ2_GOSAR|nr:hypothetical protein F383_07608 [Gossypium arboreum]